MPHKDPIARRAYLKKRYAENAEVRRKCAEQSKRWAQQNPQRMTELQKNHRRKWHKDHYRTNIRPKLYSGIYPETPTCEACDGKFDPRKKEPHADHDHATGLFRGWLCAGCNIALGMVNDSPERLKKLGAYLDRNI